MRCKAKSLMAATVVLSGCIWLPHTTHQYNPDCEIDERKMTLEAYQVATLGGCANEGCVALLAAAGVVSAASAVVSGSVVVTGNVVYWLEKKGSCIGKKGEARNPDAPRSTQAPEFPDGS